MKHNMFEKILNRRIELTKSVLASKNVEYASDSDKLHNFKRACKMIGCSPEKALIGMATKHFISILDIVDKIDSNKNYVAKSSVEVIAKVEEKIGDAINYLILLEALIKERYEAWVQLQ